MEFIYVIIGIVIIVWLLQDFAMTVFIPKGAGSITQTITRAMARLLKFITGNDGSKKILDYKALIIIISMILSWIILTWIGISLIYASDHDSILFSDSMRPASFKEKIYFTGSTISTLGLGDYQPNGTFWQWFTAVVSLLGFMIVTICITYIVPVINNIIEKNVLSLRIASMGESSVSILANGYNGENFGQLSDQFAELSTKIFQYAKNHGAYPILHHVHDIDTNENTILKLASLDEACTILLYHIPRENCLQDNNLQQLRRALTYYLKSVSYVKPSNESPPLPDFDEISNTLELELRNTSGEDMKKIYKKLEMRRRMFKGLIEDDGFKWHNQEGDKFDTQLDLSNSYNRLHAG